MTHAYHHFATACICGEQPEHHDHTESDGRCLCEGCQIDPSVLELWGPVWRWVLEQPITLPGTPYELVPATFKPQEQQ